jgi:hypothetical protein
MKNEFPTGVFIVLLIAILVAIGIFKKDQVPTPVPQAERLTLSGEYTCLKPLTASSTVDEVCRPGLRTADGKYYAYDSSMSSQIAPTFSIGDQLVANGVFTPIELISTNQWQRYNIVGIFSATDSIRKLNDSPIGYMCDGDGKICPDGSTVGRTGSDCQFAMCPALNATTATIITSMGQATTAMNVSITPKELISDSRCPVGVQCVWAGTVEVKALATTAVSHGEQIFKLGVPAQFGNFNITLIEVTPARLQEQAISASEYRFTWKIDKRR